MRKSYNDTLVTQIKQPRVQNRWECLSVAKQHRNLLALLDDLNHTSGGSGPIPPLIFLYTGVANTCDHLLR